MARGHTDFTHLIYRGNKGIFQVCNRNRGLYRRHGGSHGGRR
jgi:hypothetical protein